jgi:hypothetical protein
MYDHDARRREAASYVALSLARELDGLVAQILAEAAEQDASDEPAQGQDPPDPVESFLEGAAAFLRDRSDAFELLARLQRFVGEFPPPTDPAPPEADGPRPC